MSLYPDDKASVLLMLRACDLRRAGAHQSVQQGTLTDCFYLTDVGLLLLRDIGDTEERWLSYLPSPNVAVPLYRTGWASGKEVTSLLP
jgi:hypothetical protein